METPSAAPSSWTGGCQCGAVRYALMTPPLQVNVCYCRMCQKASGGPFMAFARVAKQKLRWTRGSPAAFRSSSLAERHFCSACGTPLSYNKIDGPNISVTACSLDDPEGLEPALQYSIERRLPWLAAIEALPSLRTEQFITEELAARFVSNQHPDHDETA